jgi:tetratricopeptide (TPR) repeat protein
MQSNSSDSEGAAVFYIIIGNWSSANGNYKKAGEYFQTAKRIRKHLFGEMSTEYAWTLFTEAENYFRRNGNGDNETAKNLFCEVIAIYNNTIDKDERHKYRGLAYEYLGDICCRNGNLNEALNMYQTSFIQLSTDQRHYVRVNDKYDEIQNQLRTASH